MSDDLYKRAGVEDLSEFYRTKFVSDEVLDARYFRALDRFDMRFARTMWVYDNVRAGSSVLDLGCGAGMLALLKRKGVTLAGVDLSSEGALASRRNGYDLTCAAVLTRLPFKDNSFDYVVSLDVLGHVAFEEKDAVLSEIRRVLRPGGVAIIYEDIPATLWDRFICWTHDLKWRKRTGACTFRSESDWLKVFESAGFKIIHERQLARLRNLTHPVCRRFFLLNC